MRKDDVVERSIDSGVLPISQETTSTQTGSEAMYRRTGEISVGRGVYHSECRCRAEVRIRRGDHFPICPRCKLPVGWIFSKPFSTTPQPPRAVTPPEGTAGAGGTTAS